jgi:REP element-mobilizing transposase RayT
VPRKPRNEHAGAIYHVFARGVNRQRVFVDDEDYERYTSLLGATVRRQGWHCLSYCLMPNHVHLLIETPEPNLGAGMQWLHGLYAQTFNERHHRVGHVFQDRYRCEPIDDEVQLITVVGYIVLNPVAATLCARPQDWRWGSHASLMSLRPPMWLGHERLAEHLEGATGSRCYADLVSARLQLTTDTTLK